MQQDQGRERCRWAGGAGAGEGRTHSSRGHRRSRGVFVTGLHLWRSLWGSVEGSLGQPVSDCRLGQRHL